MAKLFLRVSWTGWNIRYLAFECCLLLFATEIFAQGGPPFRTDDPETPGNHHWEVNVGLIGNRNPAGGEYQVPDFDFNYGLGDRIQLKYELPIAVEEARPQVAEANEPAVSGQVVGGLGESLLGIKWRFYEHNRADLWTKNGFGTGLLGLRRRPTKPMKEIGTKAETGENLDPVINLSVSMYPQLFIDNPTRAVLRGLVAPGPTFFLPLEVNARLRTIRVNGEVGYNFGNRDVAQSWSRGLLVGRELNDRTEAYLELYDQQDANRIAPGRGVGQFATGSSKQRAATLGLGGRRALTRAKTLNLLLMAGRSFQTVSVSNGQRSWIAYLGLQILLGPQEPPTRQVEQKLPDESKR